MSKPPAIEKVLTEKEEKAVIEAFNFIISGNDSMEHARRLTNDLIPVYKLLSNTATGGLGNFFLGLINELQKTNTGIPMKNYQPY